MANGYDAHSMKATGLSEASSSNMPTAVKDKRFTRNGIGYRTQKEATSLNPGAVGQNPPPIIYGDDYAGGTAGRKRGMDEAKRPWETAQEATSPQIRPRDTLERSGIQENGDWGNCFPSEGDARMALAMLSQFVDGPTLAKLQDQIEDQYGDPMAAPPTPEPDWDDDESFYMGESGLQEAPLDAQKRNALDSSDFALPGRRYPIDTPARARAALARVKQFGKEGEEAKVKAAVKKKYPNMDVS